MCTNFSPELLGDGWVGGGEGGEGVGGGEGGGQSTPSGAELPIGGPDRTTRLKGHHSSQG